jgi:TolB-like protein/Tfp pilus assembly protein PilF
VNLLAELKTRGVLKIATVYLVVTWLILEVGQTLFSLLELPHTVLQLVFVLLVLGFPAVITVSWLYRIGATTDEQIARAADSRGAQLAVVVAIVALLAIATAIGMRYFAIGAKSSHPDHAPGAATAEASTPQPEAPAFAPPAHSVAVLPFVNMSGDAEQDYFSDGLSEELLNALARLDQLSVAARTSSFYFKGKAVDISEVARKLNVASVLEGSVRKSGNTVRITAQLINAVTGYHVWSQTYDRDLQDILALQTEIATAISEALQVKLLGDPVARLQLGSTRNPKALDAYLRGRALSGGVRTEADMRDALAAYDEAITLDPRYALAHAARANTLQGLASNWMGPPESQRMQALAREAAERAIALAPGLGEAHGALASVLALGFLDFARASVEHERAVQLAPGSASVQTNFATFSATMGRPEVAVTAARRALVLDPLNARTHRALGNVLYFGRRYAEAVTALTFANEVVPGGFTVEAAIASAYYGLGDYETARTHCEREATDWLRHVCLALVLHRLGNHREAQTELERLQRFGDSVAYQYAQIYAQWGKPAQALDQLDLAFEERDPGLVSLKVDALLDPIRREPRFQKILAELKFPE